MKSSSKKDPKTPVQGVKVNEEMTYVPPKLLNFDTSARFHKFLPELTLKPKLNPESERLFLKKMSEPQIQLDDRNSGYSSTPRNKIVSTSKIADEILRSDRKYNRKIDLLKGSSDISYLLETDKYKQKLSFNEHFNKTLSHSAQLLSPMNQNSFLQKTLYGSNEKQDRIKTDANETYFPLDEIRGSEGPLPKSLSKLRKIVTTCMEDDEEPLGSVLVSERNQKGNKSPGRIVDAVSAGLDNCVDINQNTIKAGLKKVQAKALVEHRSQNTKLAIPSGRKEVIGLSNWLNEMLERIYKEETIKTERIFEDIQLIYTACLQEIIRQVKTQCGERGQLLEKIWEAYIDLFDRVIRENTKSRSDLEDEYLKEIEDINKIYLMRQDQMNKELEKIKKEKDEFQLNFEKKKEELHYLKKKSEKQDLQLISQKEWIEEVGTEMERLRADNTDFRKLILESEVKLQMKFAEMQKNTDLRFKLRKLAAERKKQEHRRKHPISFANLSENITSIAKLEETTQNNLAGADDERSPRLQEYQEVYNELYKEIAVDTSDLGVIINVIQNQDNENYDSDKSVDYQDEQLNELSHVMKRLSKKESYEILNDLESKLYEKISGEDDGEVKGKLVSLLSEMVKNEADLDNSDYKDLATEIMKNSVERSGNASPDLQQALGAMKGMGKDKLLRVFDMIHRKLKRKKQSSQEQELMNFMKGFINDEESAKFDNVELKEVYNRVKYLQGKRRGRAERRLEFVDPIKEEEETPTSSESEIEKANFMNFLNNKKLNDWAGVDINNANRATIKAFSKTIRTRTDLKEQDLKLLLSQVLGALDKSLLQITALKVTNYEQDLELQEINEKKEELELRIIKLEEELEEYRNRVMNVEHENESLNNKLLKIQTSLDEKKKTKTNKLSTIMHTLHKFKALYGRRKKSVEDTNSNSQNPENEDKATSMVDNQVHHDGDDAEKFMKKIVNMIEGESGQNMEEIDEENWSDNEGGKENGSMKPLLFKNSSDLQQCSVPFGRSTKNTGGRRGTVYGTTIIKSFNLSQSQSERMTKALSVNFDSAKALLIRTKEKKSVKAALPKLTVLKFISQIYSERIRASGALRELQLHVAVYDYFINKYGFKKIAETKCQQMFEAILSYSENRRIKRFRDLVGLGESWEAGEFDLYLTMFKAVDSLGNGNIIASSTLEKVLIYYEYAEMAAQGIFGKKIDQQNIQSLQSKLSKFKIIDKSGTAMIEFEDVADEFFSVQKCLEDKTRDFVQDIFNAADLDSDKTITFPEFDILYKHLEKDLYNKDDVKRLFFEEADLLLTDGSNEKVLSFDKFTSVCLDQSLFTQQKQKIFAKDIDPADKIQTIQDLEDNLKERLNELRLRFIKVGSYNSQLKEVLSKLYNNIKNPLKPRNVVWLTYRLIDQESKSQILSYEIKRMLPQEFLIIQRFVEDYEDWS